MFYIFSHFHQFGDGTICVCVCMRSCLYALCYVSFKFFVELRTEIVARKQDINRNRNIIIMLRSKTQMV